MKYAVLSDIHANYPALKAVVDEVEDSVDGYIFLGDIVGLMGFPRESVELVKDISVHALRGNHDIAVLEKKEGHVNSEELSKFELESTQNALTDAQIEWVNSLSSYKEVPSEGLLMSHAEPVPEAATGYYPAAGIGTSRKNALGLSKGSYTQAAAVLDSDTFNFVLVGHTHDQSAVDCSKFGHDIIVLNPGTTGQSKERGTAEYAIIDTEEKTYSLNKAEYDWDEVVSRLEEVNVPKKWWV